MWLIRASLKNPYMVATLVFVLLALGLLAVANLPEDILPVFKSPAVQVLTYYQGMPASSVEKTITNRVERWVNQSPGAARVESKSVPGVSIVKVFFRDDIDPTTALTMTNSLALGTLPTLPPNTLPPVVLPFDPTATMPLGILTVSIPNQTEADVKDFARIDVRNMLGAVPGCVAPVVVGGRDRTILIYLKPKEMEARGVSPLDVVGALQKGNLMVTPGTAYFADNQVLLDSNAMVKDVSELNSLPIRIKAGDNVYLRDIGRAEDSSTIQTSRVRIDGAHEVYVPIYRQQGASSLTVVDKLKEHIPFMLERLPAGTKLEFLMDQTESVRETIRELLEEGAVGALLVSLMILLFLGNARMTVIASTSIPLAVLGALIGLYATGNTINAMTLGGLALAIGPLVDDAIVALENIHRHGSMGKTRIKAALDGSVEVMVPVMVATCTTMIVLAPLALMPGMGGFLFKPLALAVAFAMLTSFLLSRTYVPMMCAVFLKEHAPAGHGHGHEPSANGEVHTHAGGGVFGIFGAFSRRFERFMDGVTRGYSAALRWALGHRFFVLGAVLTLFVASLGLTFGIGREFFPQVDAGQITMYVRAPSNLRLDAAEERVAAVEKVIQEVIPADELTEELPDGSRQVGIVSELGLDPDWSAAYTANSGQQDSVIRIQLNEKRRKSSQEYAVALRHKIDDDPRFSDLRVSFDTGGMVSAALNFGASSPIDLQIQFSSGRGGNAVAAKKKKEASWWSWLPWAAKEEAPAPPKEEAPAAPPESGDKTPKVSPREVRQRVADMAQEIRTAVAGVKGAADVRVLQRIDAPYLIIKVDRVKAAAAGLSAQDVVQQVVAAMNSSVSINRNFWIDTRSGNQYFVAVQYPENPSVNLNDLLNVYATSATQPNAVKLSSLAELVPDTGSVEITHESLYPTFDVLVNTEHRDLAGVAGDITPRLRELQHTAWEKEWKDKGEPAGTVPPDQDDGGLRFPHGMSVRLKGEYGRMNESLYNLAIGLAMAAVLVYLLQVALFRSWVGPFIIMFTVPLGLIGVLTTLFLTNTTLNVQSEMGVIFLVGIAVNNGVLLVDFANKQRQQGATARDAVMTAAAIRLRPILMTFLATFLDLTPMAIGMGGGGPNVPLARAVVGGLLTSTCLTLFVVPILYSFFMRDGADPVVDLDAETADKPAEDAPLPHHKPADGVMAAGAAAS